MLEGRVDYPFDKASVVHPKQDGDLTTGSTSILAPSMGALTSAVFTKHNVAPLKFFSTSSL
jgi:hypothetical protein